MAQFSARVMERKKTLGERLQKVREEAGRPLGDLEHETGIQARYLAALEAGDYAVLPGPVYIESFLRRYARALGVDENFVIDVFRQQEQRVLQKQYRAGYLPPKRILPRPVITPRVIRFSLIGLVIGICLTYLGLELANIFSPPQLTIIEPDSYSTVVVRSITVKGSTTPEATVSINGRQIFLDSQGNFSEVIDLREGLNTITITAMKKKSKSTEAVRQVLVEELPDVPEVTL